MSILTKVTVSEKVAALHESWSPRLLGALNGQQVKLARFEGEFVWHAHEQEDELFLVVQGRIAIHLREDGVERCVELDEGEFLIVPRGVEHKPEAAQPAYVLLFEPATTLNTGDVVDERTIRPDELQSM